MRFDIKTVSEANQSEHWRTKHKRKKQQQEDFAWLWRAATQFDDKTKFTFPATITFTRYSCKEMDTDNLAGAFKHVQDQLARELGIDDGDGSVKWKYEQVRIPKRVHYFEVKIENA